MNKSKKSKKSVKVKKLSPGAVLVLKIVLIVFISVVLIFFAARMLGGITLTGAVENIRIAISNLGAGDGYPFSIEGSEVVKTYNDSDKIFTFSDDRTMLISSSAKELSTVAIDYGFPKIDYKDGKAIVYDTDSGKLRIQNTSKIVTELDVENRITCGAVGEKGNFAVSTMNSNNQIVFTVFNKSAEEAFSWNFGSEFVTCIDLSDDGKFAVVGTVTSVSAGSDSKVYVFKFDAKDYVSCFDFDSSIIVSVRYVKSHDIEVITDKQRAYIEDNNSKESEVFFDSDKLHDIAHIDSRYTAVSLLRYGSDSDIVVDVYDGEDKLCSIPIASSAKAVSVNERYVAVLTDNKILIYNKKGKAKAELSVDVSAKDIVLGNKKVYVISPVEIECFKF